MSKLAHSNAGTMLDIDIAAAFEDGRWDLLGMRPIEELQCEMHTRATNYQPEQRCHYRAKYFDSETGTMMCGKHASSHVRAREAASEGW